MKKYISIICFLLFISCETIEKENGLQSTVSIEKTIQKNKEKRNIVILPYSGKYVSGQNFFNLDKIVQLQKYTEELLAKRIGLLQQKELEIEITYKDWTDEEKNISYIINQRIENNQVTWEITYITEHLQNGFMKPSNIYLLSLAEVFISNLFI